MEKADETDPTARTASQCVLNDLASANSSPHTLSFDTDSQNTKLSVPVISQRSSSLVENRSQSEQSVRTDKFDCLTDQSIVRSSVDFVDLDNRHKSAVADAEELSNIEFKRVELELREAKIKELQEQVDRQVSCLHDSVYLLQNSPAYVSLYASHQELESRNSMLNGVDFENTELRSYIASMHEGTGPHRDESYFKTKISHLEQKIKEWSMEYAPTSRDWKDIKTDHFLQVLEGVSQHGYETVQFVKKRRRTDMYSMFHDTRTRRHFYAHLISLELYTRVLSVFAFGLDRPQNDTLDDLQDIILHQGL